MKTLKLFYLTMILSLLSLYSIAQTTDKQIEEPIIATEKLEGDITLYVINDVAYLGDTTCTILDKIPKPSVNSIEVIADKKQIQFYLEKAGEYSDSITLVIVIWAMGEYDFKYIEEE